MLKITFLILLTFASCFEIEEEYLDEEIEEYEKLNITDVLKMMVLPSPQEISNILTSQDNSTEEPSPKLNFILQAVEYWRKHNMPENLENVKGENITQVTFNLQDEFFDDDDSVNWHLRENTQKKRDLGASLLSLNPVRTPNTRISAIPYVYVRNVYLMDNLFQYSQDKKE